MGVLTVVLDEVGERSPTPVGRYSAALTHALAMSAPSGFDVAALSAKVSDSRQARIRDLLPGLAELRQTAVPARELRQAWLHSLTTLPVIGVPVKSANSIDGWDSVLSILQMPGGIPVATVALNGALNAGLLAAQILGTTNAAIADRLEKYKTSLKDKVMRSVDELKRGDRDEE